MRNRLLMQLATFLIALGYNYEAKTQVAISPALSGENLFAVQHLLEASLINTGPIEIRGALEISVEGPAGIPVISARSSAIRLEPGGMALPGEIHWPGNMRFGTTAISAYIQQTGILPAGEYVVCYRFISLQNEVLAVHCQEHAVRGWAQPALLSPPDREYIATPFPVLSWKPPAPLDGPGISYYLHLVKVAPGQTPYQAIQVNPPLLNIRGIQELSLIYPATAFPLRDGETYAWQVTAFTGNAEIGQTEVWAFTIGEQSEENQRQEMTPGPKDYRKLKPGLDGGIYECTDVVRFAFDNRQLDSSLVNQSNYSIAPFKALSNEITGLPTFSLDPGLNLVEFTSGQLTSLASGEEYLLKATDRLGNVYYLPFKYISTAQSSAYAP